VTDKPKRKELIIRGSTFTNLEEAALEFTRALGLSEPWHGNLDAFNDFLNGGFGTPNEGFVLVWKDSHLSRLHLGQEETSRWYERTITTCHHSNVPRLNCKLQESRQGRGETLFDWIVEIIRSHKDIELRLE
jgi:hypothetical protein